MMFATLADRSGVAECVLFPGVYRAFAEVMRASIVRVEGRVDDTLGAVTLVVERAEALDGSATWAAGAGAPPGTPGVRTHEVSRSRNAVGCAAKIVEGTGAALSPRHGTPVGVLQPAALPSIRLPLPPLR